MHAPAAAPQIDPNDDPILQDIDRSNNLVELFLTRADEKRDEPFLGAKRDGEWHTGEPESGY